MGKCKGLSKKDQNFIEEVKIFQRQTALYPPTLTQFHPRQDQQNNYNTQEKHVLANYTNVTDNGQTAPNAPNGIIIKRINDEVEHAEVTENILFITEKKQSSEVVLSCYNQAKNKSGEMILSCYNQARNEVVK